jgi:hypothetical protein
VLWGRTLAWLRRSSSLRGRCASATPRAGDGVRWLGSHMLGKPSWSHGWEACMKSNGWEAWKTRTGWEVIFVSHAKSFTTIVLGLFEWS